MGSIPDQSRILCPWARYSISHRVLEQGTSFYIVPIYLKWEPIKCWRKRLSFCLWRPGCFTRSEITELDGCLCLLVTAWSPKHISESIVYATKRVVLAHAWWQWLIFNLICFNLLIFKTLFFKFFTLENDIHCLEIRIYNLAVCDTW